MPTAAVVPARPFLQHGHENIRVRLFHQVYQQCNCFLMPCLFAHSLVDDPIDYAKLFSNPFAVGHFANHPPKDTRPNVASLPFDFKEDDFPVCLRRYIPNAHFLPQPATSDAPPRTLVSGLVLVATKDLGV